MQGRPLWRFVPWNCLKAAGLNGDFGWHLRKNSQKPCKINVRNWKSKKHTHTHRENIGGKKRYFFRKGVKNLVARYTKKLKECTNIPRCC